MKTHLALLAASAMVLTSAVAGEPQPAADQSTTSAAPAAKTQPDAAAPAAKTQPDVAAPAAKARADPTCAAPAKGKSAAKDSGGTSAAKSESVKTITRDTGDPPPPPKTKKVASAAAARDCTT